MRRCVVSMSSCSSPARNREWISWKKAARHCKAKSDSWFLGRVGGEGRVVRRERMEVCQLHRVPIKSKKRMRALGKGMVDGDMVVFGKVG